jgi:hypothetical protein
MRGTRVKLLSVVNSDWKLVTMNLEPTVLAALVTGTISLIIAMITFFSSRANQRDVEKLKAELVERKSERDARRDYEYEARKRLYQEYEPLFFQFTESAEVALGHIQSLAERGREGGSGGMSNDELKACLHERQNDLHHSYTTLSLARISRL